jgi:phosphoribosylformylglycinamidine synthase
MRVRVTITLKAGVLDPQGKAIEGALAGLGFTGIEAARQGKIIDLVLAETDPDAARRTVAEMCEKLLANTVVENYAIDVVG